jgi:hypothetical protein
MMEDKAIGGYFELELSPKEEYHKNAIRLNTARNAFEYILKAKRNKKAYIPYFTCSAMLEPLKRNGIKYEFYNIDENLEPLFDFSTLTTDDAFLYTNYFGLKDLYIHHLKMKCTNLIIDNAQSFFSKPLEGIDTFYSPRKFFGLPDGAYLYTDTELNEDLETDTSFTRFNHLLKRIDLSAEEGYTDFLKSDENLVNNPIRKMSNLTSKLLTTINYDAIARIRKHNFNYLHCRLKSSNKLSFELNILAAPMVYPYWGSEELRIKLLKHKIYTATYWPNVKEWCDKNSLEYRMTTEVVYLPIDQRYGAEEMDTILKLIL